jgi:hypothetical protein
MIRVTPLNLDGSIDAGRPILTTNGFITASFGTEFEDGDEITEKAADGSICIQYKADDSMKGITFNLSLCSPDPEASALLAGGKIICAAADVLDGSNVVVTAGEIIGYSSPAVGASVGNPVAVEIWSKAIVNGKPASGTPYWHWVFPYVRVRYEGDREFSNGALSNEFSGTGVGNDALTTTGLNPVTVTDDFVTYKEALANPFSYVRTKSKPDISAGHWTGGSGNSGDWDKNAANSIGCAADRGTTSNGDAFPPDVDITASDATNAAKLTAEGFIASPTTTWPTGQKITIGTYEFFWAGATDGWKPGNSARYYATPGTTFPADTQITASDSTNAAKLTGEGFKPAAANTANWTTGQKITVGTYDFNWNGTAWAAGAHA